MALELQFKAVAVERSEKAPQAFESRMSIFSLTKKNKAIP